VLEKNLIFEKLSLLEGKLSDGHAFSPSEGRDKLIIFKGACGNLS